MGLILYLIRKRWKEMQTEEQIVRQIKLFQEYYLSYIKMYKSQEIESSTYHVMQLQSMEREIEALEWVIGRHIEWSD
jgi:hypothetical protein